MSSLRFALVLLSACGASPAIAPPPPPTSRAPEPVVSASAVATVSATEEPIPPPEPPPTVALGSWARESGEPGASIAIGEKRVAVLTRAGGRYRSVWQRENGRWHELPLPARMLAGEGERDDWRIWFGRDDRPRIMGTRTRAGGGAAMVYLRWKGSWRDKAGEIGRLDKAPPAALFGVLGHADPEVVCKLGDACIVKRVTGWTTIAPPNEPLVIELAGTFAVGAGAKSALRLAPDGWQPLAGAVPWTTPPSGLWADAGDTVWVAEPARDRLHRWDGKAWSEHPSPCTTPRALWGRAPDDVWLAAADGAAHWDGTRWTRLAEPTGDFSDIRGRASELWLAGAAGIWRSP